MSLDVDLKVRGRTVYSANITHNLNRMAEAAGIYRHVWRPEEIGIEKARDLIVPLLAGVSELLDDEERFRKFDAENGWGRYHHLVSFLSSYLDACVMNPNSTVEACR